MVRSLGVFSVGMFAALALYLAPLEPSLVALQLTFSAQSFRQVLYAWGPEGVALFRSHLPFDGVLLLAYGAFGYLAAARTRWFAAWYRGRQAPLAILLLMPLTALADCLENTFHWFLTGTSAPQLEWLYWMSGAFASLKFAGIACFAVLAVVARIRRPG